MDDLAITEKEAQGAARSEAGTTDLQITLCGSAGDGTIAAGEILRNAMARAGFHVIGFDVIPAEIRGFGKCVARTRIADRSVFSLREKTDILVSLDDSHALPHVGEVREFGAVIREGSPLAPSPEGKQIAARILPGHIPYKLDMRLLSERATNSARSRNIVALGFLAGRYNMPQEAFHDVIDAKFRKKGAVRDSVRAAFDAGFAAAEEAFKFDFIRFGEADARAAAAGMRIVTGNEALCRGALDAGVDTFFGYPITPASSILERLAVEMPKRGGRLLQTEDEISAIAATIGAGYAGSRAATATSGPGLALMVEMLGLGVMAEIPAVVFVSQRAGPSTGMPTKTEQSDLNLAIYGASGDGQRLVVAPTNAEECYDFGGRAFELAETFQTPVLVLLDLYLSNRSESVSLPEKSPFRLDVDRRTVGDPDGTPFLRYAASADGVSPRAVPGDACGIHTITGLEHNAEGRPADAADNHGAMTAKRHDKLLGAQGYPGLKITERYGDSGKVDVGLVAWGSTFGEAMEAVRIVRSEGVRCAALKVLLLSPLPVDPIQAFLADCREVLVPELNHQGQFATLLTGHTGRAVERLNGVTGVPMSVAAIADEIRRLAGRSASKAA